MLLVAGSEQQTFTQKNQLLAKFVLQLGSMQVQRNEKPGEDIVAEQHAMTLLHVEKFDGENVGRSLHFLASEHQGCVLLLAGPPLDGGRHRGQGRERRLAQYAEQVDI